MATLQQIATVPAFTIRSNLRPGDLGAVIQFHGVIYAKEWGFDATFEAYVAEPLAQFIRSRTDRDRLWIAEKDGRLAGCIAIVGVSEREAQLRWFLVDPAARGAGLGKKLLNQAVDFARDKGYESVFLWTVSALTTAAHLYQSAGFVKVEEKPGAWGVSVLEEKYVLDLKRKPLAA